MEKQNLSFEDLSLGDIPSILEQYREIKKQYKDFIVFFQMGGFYEVYFDDAKIVSEITGIQLTKRKYKIGSIPMAGVSSKALDDNIKQIIKENYKVAVVLQYLDENEAVKRKVSKIYTRGTILKEEFLNANKNNYLLSIYKTDELYELCYADVSVGQIFASSGSKSDIINELSRIQPVEIITSKEQKIDFLQDGIKIEKIEASNFEIENNYSHAVSGLLNYAKNHLKEDMIEFEDLKKYSIQNILSIDFRTRKNLELTENAYNNSYKGSFLWALNNCKTPMGTRLLSSFLSTPLTNSAEIKRRQEILKRYLKDDKTQEKINSLLDETGDLLRLSAVLSNETITPKGFFNIKEDIKNISEISKILTDKNYNLTDEKCDFELILSFYEILNNTIKDDINDILEGNFLKPGVDSAFDILIEEENAVKKRLFDYEKSLIEKTGILKLKIIRKQGSYLIEIPSSSIKDLPSDFKIIQRLSTVKRFITDELIEIENQILTTENKISEAKTAIFNNLKKYAQSMTPAIRSYAKLLGGLDVLNSFYILNKSGRFCFGEINENCFELKGIRHLAAEKLNGCEPVDIDFSDKNFMILTGANGIGKSTLLKTISTVIILSQSGFIAPADSIKLPVFNNLFSILSMSDELINKKSVHEAQMKALSEICANMNQKSIVLLDEFGKNTSYEEGISLACGLIKYFIEKTSAKTIFATHFTHIKEIIQPLNSKISYKKIDLKNDKRAVESGIIIKSDGIKSAEKENIPKEITKYAGEILKNFSY